MNGITEIRMRKIQSRTRQYRRRYEWREISCLTVCSLFLLAGIGILLGHIQEPGISSVAEGYGAVLLRNGADLYVTIGIASFTAGVVMRSSVSVGGRKNGHTSDKEESEE